MYMNCTIFGTIDERKKRRLSRFVITDDIQFIFFNPFNLPQNMTGEIIGSLNSKLTGTL